MKFSVILSNPPYGIQHLKFLSRYIDIAAEIISIQPTNWIMDIYNKYRPTKQFCDYGEIIGSHLHDIEIIDIEKSKLLFGCGFSTPLGIYYLTQKGGYDYKKLYENKIIDKIYNYIENNQPLFEYNKKDGYRIKFSEFIFIGTNGCGSRKPTLCNLGLKDIVFYNGYYNGKIWWKNYMGNQHQKKQPEIPLSLKFNTEEEGYNFLKSLKTKFGRYVTNYLTTYQGLIRNKILWMNDYTKPWTDERFYKYFDINETEKKIIEDLVDDMDKKIQEYEDEKHQI